ncbi:MAG: 50S ribosomal protein L23 [Burkholderiales bacterium]|nr:50S ribosomal protein L23 [Anaerolineae bacterium]
MAETSIYDVLLRPVVTEKSTVMSETLNQYVFEVGGGTNKIQIKEAVEILFEVNVTNVRTMVMPAKRGRRGRNWYMRSKQWKKAIVTLAAGNEIKLFDV